MLKKRAKILIVIAGPTAVGKTDLAIGVAKKLKTEIISADSRQFFRELEIGTAKPSSAQLQEVRHHLVNSHSIAEEYDAARFANDALEIINNIFAHNDTVILCGGSGLYIKALCEGFDDIPPVDERIRMELTINYETHGLTWLQKCMAEEDAAYFAQIDQSNPHRLIRALEVKRGTGKSLSSFFSDRSKKHDFEILKIGLELPRDLLYERIDSRMDQMIQQGLFDEAKSLYPFKGHQALQTVGYQEIFDFLDGLYDRDEAVRLLKRNSRRYAKRQMTWFRKDTQIRWFDARNHELIVSFILEKVKQILS